MNTCESLAAEANRQRRRHSDRKRREHRFRDENATMVGRLLTLTSGVRQLFIEAGWPRVPRDGVVRGGGLARANLRHLGVKSANESLLLVTTKGSAALDFNQCSWPR